ncbi:AAA family ATPase [Neptuniibacter sp. QD34_54]|uniref:AAA family ATPase n=1 Tax=Neptuniibacter sp. QD34_54 TaxID=3398208 RepID=UPI0039F4A1AA
MKVKNTVTGDVIDLSSDKKAKAWANSTSPWVLLERSKQKASEKQKIEISELIQEILTWSETKLSLWQRDALRRLFSSTSNLNSDDYSELYSMLKVENGIEVKSSVTPIPLSKAHIPVSHHEGDKVILKTVRDFENVNRIATGQKLELAPSGMTVIYGGNGTGKSGYVRVLKKVCRARGLKEDVLPDAKTIESDPKVPSAKFDFIANGQFGSSSWVANAIPPDDLSKLTVFDTSTARAHLTEEQEVELLPFGLDLLEKLTNVVIPAISELYKAELISIDTNLTPFEHLTGPTAVGHEIGALGVKTKPEVLEKLADLSEKDFRRLEELKKALSVTDPEKKAQDLLLSANRLREYLKSIEACSLWVSDKAVEKLKAVHEQADKSARLAKEAAEKLRSGEDLLEGTGDDIWKEMFAAARRFSEEQAYPESSFPHLSTGAVCPLCQQDVDNVSDRLTRFEEFIQNDIAKKSENDKSALSTALTKIKNAKIDICANTPILDELRQLDSEIINELLVFRDSMKSRREWMLNDLSAQSINLSESPIKRLRNIIAAQLRSYRTFLKAIDVDKKAELTKEKQELDARLLLSKSLEAVQQLRLRIVKKRQLENCEKNLKTQQFSRKAKELAASVVTGELKAALDQEFGALGISHIRTKLKDRTVKGKVKHKLLLDLSTNLKLDSVLSEGEQRAIALGAFLAELKISDHKCGVIFDDPVSSLDHVRRSRVARRFSNEAKMRQVIVFTHDAVFLSDLRKMCEESNVDCSFRYLEQVQGDFGNVSEGLPWVHKSYGDRLNSIELELKELEKDGWPEYPSDSLTRKIIAQYNDLRATIEKCVEEVALGRTVQRFDSYIRVNNLHKAVSLEKPDVDEISRLTNKCHDLVDAHDPSSARNDPPPSPTELRKDIEDLKVVLEGIKSRH